MNAANVIEKPIEPKTEIVNPVLKESDLEISKSIFNDAMKEAKEASPEERSIDQDGTEKGSRGRPKKVTEPTKSKEIPPVADSKVDGDPPKPDTSKPSTAHASELPEDIFTPADKKEEVKPSEAVAEIEAMKLPGTPKAEILANFGELKEASKKHITRLESELAALRSQNGTNGDYEALKKQNTEWQTKYGELEERFGRELYTQSPKFQREFTEREQSALSRAKSYLDDPEGQGNLVDMLSSMTPKRRKEVLTEQGIDPSGILGALDRFDEIQQEKSKAISDWKTDVARSVEQQNAYQQEQESKRKEQEESVWKEAMNGMDLIPLRKSKDESWNSRGSQILERAKQMFNGETDLKTLAVNQIKGEAYDALDSVVKHLAEQLKDVRAENSKLKANKPGGEMSSSIPSATKNEQHQKMDQTESSKAIFNEFMSQARGQ